MEQDVNTPLTQEMNLTFGKECRTILLYKWLLSNRIVPARWHKRKRIRKKWLKRFGWKRLPDPNIYFTEDKILMHPSTFKKFQKILGSEDAAMEYISKLYNGGGKPT